MTSGGFLALSNATIGVGAITSGGTTGDYHVVGEGTTLTLNSSIVSTTQGIVKADAGTLIFGALQYYTGVAANNGTTVNGGTLRLSAGNNTILVQPTGSIPTVLSLFMNGGTLDLKGNSQIVERIANNNVNAGTGGVIINSGGSPVTLTSATGVATTFAGSIGTGVPTPTGNSINFIKSGNSTLTLINVNSYTGTTRLRGGGLTLQDSASLANERRHDQFWHAAAQRGRAESVRCESGSHPGGRADHPERRHAPAILRRFAGFQCDLPCLSGWLTIFRAKAFAKLRFQNRGHAERSSVAGEGGTERSRSIPPEHLGRLSVSFAFHGILRLRAAPPSPARRLPRMTSDIVNQPDKQATFNLLTLASGGGVLGGGLNNNQIRITNITPSGGALAVSSSLLVNGMLPAWLTVNGSDFAGYLPSANSGSQGIGAIGSANFPTYNLSANATMLPVAGHLVGSVAIRNPGGGTVIPVNLPTDTLSIRSGGLLINSGQAVNIQGGRITAGSVANGGLTHAASVLYATATGGGTMTINSQIVDNGTPKQAASSRTRAIWRPSLSAAPRPRTSRAVWA